MMFRSYLRMILCFLLIGFSFACLHAQERRPIPDPTGQSRMAPSYELATMLRLDQADLTPVSESMWDSLYAYSASDSVSIGANLTMAAMVFNGSEYWVSEWDSDKFYRFNADGSLISQFNILDGTNLPIGGTRGMTWDGSHIYLSTNANIIYQVDPGSRSLVQSIPTPDQVRTFAYDPGADGGNGGFWISNWGAAGPQDGPLSLIDMDGNLILQVDPQSHQLSSTYGLAYDGDSPGGPYLWAFDQSGSGATIRQIKLPEGVPTGVERDVNADFATSGLAGGLFIYHNHPDFPGKTILGGLIQDNPDISFGYELDFEVVQIDAGLIDIQPVPGYTGLPIDQVQEYDFSVSVGNLGLQNLNQVSVDLDVLDPNENSLFSHQQTLSSLALGDTGQLVMGSWLPNQKGQMEVEARITALSQTDEVASNDQFVLPILIDDSTFSRDNGDIVGGLGIGAGPGQNAILGQTFELEAVDFLTSISFALIAPVAGDEVYATVFTLDSLGRPDLPLALTKSYTIRAEDAANGVLLNLPLAGDPLPMGKGAFFVGINETNQNIQLAMCEGIFSPGTTWVNWDNIPTGEWTNTEFFGFDIAYWIRPHFGLCYPTYMSASVQIDQPDAGNGNAILTCMASGATGPYTYQWNDPQQQTQASATQLEGGRSYSCTVTDANGCRKTVVSDSVIITGEVGIEALLDAGLTELAVFPNPSRGSFEYALSLKKTGPIRLRVFHSGGKMVFQHFEEQVMHAQGKLLLENQPAGIYLLQIQTEQGQYMRRIIIK